MRSKTIIFLLVAAFLFTSAELKLKRKYVMRGADTFYLTFLNKKDFELEMYSCLYQIKVGGVYDVSADTILLTYNTYEHLDSARKNWIPMDSAYIQSEQVFLGRYCKLIREDRDKILRTADTRMRRTFRDIKEPYSEF